MSARLPAPARRRQLLDVASHAFAAHGYHGTSMNEVADAAGVTKPVLYQHFASKRSLYLEVLDHVGARLQSAVAKATASADSPRDQVHRGFAAYFRFVVDERDAFTLLFGRAARQEDEFADAVRAVEGSIAEAIAPLIDADLDAEHKRVLAYGLVGLAETTGRHWLAERRDVEGDRDGDPDRLAERVAGLAWGGLRGVGRVERVVDQPAVS